MTESGTSVDEYIGMPMMAQQIKKRADDLDSIEWGTPAKGGAKKLYFNSRTDTENDVRDKIDRLNRLSNYATGGVV